MEPAGRASEPAGRASEPAWRASEPAGRALEPGERALESVGRVSEPAGRALKPAEKPLEPAKRALESAGRPGAPWKDQLGARGGDGDRRRDRQRERSVPSMWWYHRSLSPTGPLPKKYVTVGKRISSSFKGMQPEVSNFIRLGDTLS